MAKILNLELSFKTQSSKKRFFCANKSRSSSHRRCSVRKGVLRNFTKFTGKHLCQRLFFDKVATSGRLLLTLAPLIPPSTAEVERTFSLMKLFCTGKRKRLSNEDLGACMHICKYKELSECDFQKIKR